MNVLAIITAVATLNTAPQEFSQQPVITTLRVIKSAHYLEQIRADDVRNITQDIARDVLNQQRGITPNPIWQARP